MRAHTRKLFKGLLECLKPPPDMTLSQWADQFRRLSSESSAEPGRWRTDKAPYQREIMDAVTDLTVPKVVVKSAAQVGKTDALILNPIGFYMHYDPSPIMVLQPTLSMAEMFSKERLKPMLRDTPVLQDMVDEKSRSSGNTILQKIFPGGHVTMVGANSAASLASRPIRILLADEVDRYPLSVDNEGDPLWLAMKRLTTFWNKKTVVVSTPTVRGTSRIDTEYDNSTQEEWCVPCPHCGKYQPFVWERVRYDENDLDDISYVCCGCGVIESESVWKEHSKSGKFIASYPRRKVRGFHLNSLASLFVSWREIVEKYIEATKEAEKGNDELIKAFWNTELGLSFERKGEQVDEEVLYKRREKYGCEVPAEVLVLTAGIDTQDDRFEIEVVGWGVDKESWGIRYSVIYGDMNQPEIWKQLDEALSQTFIRADGVKLHILSACIDSGGHHTNEVYRFCKTRLERKIWAIKGVAGAAPYIDKPTVSNRYKTPLFKIGVDTGKAILYQRLQKTEEGAGYCHFPRDKGTGYSEDYFKGLTSETFVMEYKNGRAHAVWRLKKGVKRNEPLDIRNYATAALEIANPRLVADVQTTEKKPIKRRGRQTRSGGIST